MARFDVPSSLYSPDANGYVVWRASDKIKGGHAVLIVGFVRNDDLPGVAPRAPDAGYFVVKNSWGTDNGDCGFLYIPFTLFEHAAFAFYVLDDALG